MSAPPVRRRPAPTATVVPVVLVVLAVAAAAWAVVLWLHAPVAPQGHGDHHEHGAAVPTTGLLALLGGWSVMVLAMMLPTTLPFARVLDGLARRRSRPGLLLTAGLGGYVVVWIATGAFLVVVSLGLARAADAVPWLRDHPQALPAAALLLAGGYQFSPLKAACLRACRSPRSFAYAHWRGLQPPAVESLRMGTAYGASCIGCCWALMGLGTFAGAAGLLTMVALTVLMVAERVGRTPALVRPIGVLLLVLAVLVAAGTLPTTSLVRPL